MCSSIQWEWWSVGIVYDRTASVRAAKSRRLCSCSHSVLSNPVAVVYIGNVEDHAACACAGNYSIIASTSAFFMTTLYLYVRLNLDVSAVQ